MTLVPWWCLFLCVTGCHCHIHKRGGSWNGYEFHTYPHPAKKPGVPRDTMVDVINSLGLKLLAIHNEYNENNIAISPYGALSVLVALGEGLEGDAVYEIQQAANIPHDISIIRVGLRDVHRHLKSYFIPKEGFLAGLTLNHENVTLRPEYEDILKFYGYDTISFNNALYPDPATTEIPQSTYGQITTTEEVATVLTTEIGKMETDDESTTQKVARATTEFATTTAKSITTTTDVRETGTTLVPEISSNTAQTTLAIPTVQKISTTTASPPTEMVTMEPRTTEMASTKVPTTTMDLTKLETTEILSSTERITTEEATTTNVMSTTTELSTTEKLSEETTTQPSRTTRDIPPTTIMTITELPVTTTITVTESDSTTESTTMENLLTTSQNIITTISLSSDTAVDTTSIPFTTSTEAVAGTDSNNEDTSTIPASGSSEPTHSQENAEVTSPFDTLLTTTQGSPATDNTAVTEVQSTISTTIKDESTENITNKDNEIDDDVSANDTGFGGTSKRNARAGQTNVVELNMKETSIGNANQKVNSKRRSRSVLDYIIARYYDEHYIPHLNHRPYVPKEQLSFLVYEKYREYNINFMKYDTVLPFHYAPHLNALALSFPLDSAKYYLLLLLPVDEKGIDKLICDLRLNSSLRQIIANLRYTHVLATIPSFMLKGYVTLTNSFQKLGIRKVFEPRQADFSPMTKHQGIYVTNIEQAITVTIRNYVDPNNIEQYRNLRQYDPVHFKADHPFLYFVIDSEIHVTLMAGKIVNPLNSRIS